jgi:hypothetical protein
MARRSGSQEWQLAFREGNAFDAKRRAMVQLGCEPWEVELAPYERDCNQGLRQDRGKP